MPEARRIIGGDAAWSRRIIGRNKRIAGGFRREQRREDRRWSEEDWIVGGSGDERIMVGARRSRSWSIVGWSKENCVRD